MEGTKLDEEIEELNIGDEINTGLIVDIDGDCGVEFSSSIEMLSPDMLLADLLSPEIDIVCSDNACYVVDKDINNNIDENYFKAEQTDLKDDNPKNNSPSNSHLYMDLRPEDINRIVPGTMDETNEFGIENVDWLQSTKLLTKYIIFGNQR